MPKTITCGNSAELRMPLEKGGTIAEHSSLTRLRLAADRVLQASVADSPNATDVAELIDVILEAAATDSPASSTHPGLKTPRGRVLLDSLRREVLALWKPGVEENDAADILQSLVVLEQLQTAAGETSEREAGNSLLGPEGLDLVVQVAHDLRSPLTSILFLAETLQRGQSGDVNELQHRQLGLVYSAALGLSTVTSNVIELARGGSRLSEDEPSPFSVSDILESVHDIVRPMAEEKGLIMRLLRPVSDHRMGHPHALSRVLLNLTTNGLKFTEEGFVEIMAKETSLTRIEFSVRDTGPGINAKTLDTLYQPFRRSGDGRGYDFSGTGLGLALSRRLVAAMGSELEVETRPGWGTRFYFTLELRPAEHP